MSSDPEKPVIRVDTNEHPENLLPPFFFPAPAEKPDGPAAPVTIGEKVNVMKQVEKFASEVLKQNSQSMTTLNQSIQGSYRSLHWMYWALFIVGLGTAIAAIIKGFMAKDAVDTIPVLLFAGLSAASFYSLFLVRPLESFERSTFFSSWVISIVNTYWTQVAYLSKPDSFEGDLKAVTEDLVTDIAKLVDKYMEVTGNLPALEGAAKPNTQSGGSQTGGTQSGGTQTGGSQSGGTQSDGGHSGESQSGGTQPGDTKPH